MRRFVRPLTAGLLALSTLATPTTRADAQPRCLSPAERTAFDVQALRSELMVLAVGCDDSRPYNVFIERYKPELMENEHAINSFFREKFGRRGQQEHDRFVTDLANAQASSGSRLGSEFCPRNGQIFQQAMALRTPDELPPFAAGQALLPGSLDVCPAEAARAPERKPTPRARLSRR